MENNFSGGGEVVGKSSDFRFSLHFGSTDHILGMGLNPRIFLCIKSTEMVLVSHSLREEVVWPPHLTFSRAPAQVSFESTGSDCWGGLGHRH